MSMVKNKLSDNNIGKYMIMLKPISVVIESLGKAPIEARRIKFPQRWAKTIPNKTRKAPVLVEISSCNSERLKSIGFNDNYSELFGLFIYNYELRVKHAII